MGELGFKKVKIVPPTGKVMKSVFWDGCEIIFINYLKRKNIINGEYYSN